MIFGLEDVLTRKVAVGLLVVGGDCRTLFVNDEASQLLQTSIDELYLADIRELLPASVSIPFGSDATNGCFCLPEPLELQVFTRALTAGGGKGMLMALIGRSDWQAIEGRVREQNEQIKEWEMIFDSSFDGIFVTDGDGYALRLNKAAEASCGVAMKDIVDKHVSELVAMDVFNPSVTQKVLEKKATVTTVQNTKLKKKLIATGNPVFDDSGDIVRVVTNTRDITELSNLQQKLEDTEQLIETYRNVISDLRGELFESGDLLSKTPIMEELMEVVARVACVDSTVLIEGESGVGKSLVAKKIHDLSERSGKPFVVVNCGSIPESLIESELFGYETGAFTGAKKGGKPGLIELASTGTVFFDEIGDLPANLQVKLLQVIQERKFLRVGGQNEVKVDIRILAATNRDLRKDLEDKKFREDLYYRLSVIPLVMPPLRHRRDDIPVLVDSFVKKFNSKYRFRKIISEEVYDVLKSYQWPGNIRELENFVERVIVTTREDLITSKEIPEYMLIDICEKTENKARDLKKLVANYEKKILTDALRLYPSSYRVAEYLNVDQSTVVRKMNKYKIKKISH